MIDFIYEMMAGAHYRISRESCGPEQISGMITEGRLKT